MTYTGSQLRAALLAAVEAEWDSVVESTTDKARIGQYFADIGWQWYLDEHSGGVYTEAVRRRTGYLNWCGIGPAWCALTQLGNHIEPGRCVPVRLHPSIAHHVLPSTYRANSPAHWALAEAEPPSQIPPDDIDPGDLIAVVTGENKPYGDHFAVVAGLRDGEQIPTIEFNAVGELGGGRRGRGVVRRTRRLADVRRVYRLDGRHFEYFEEQN